MSDVTIWTKVACSELAAIALGFVIAAAGDITQREIVCRIGAVFFLGGVVALILTGATWVWFQ